MEIVLSGHEKVFDFGRDLLVNKLTFNFVNASSSPAVLRSHFHNFNLKYQLSVNYYERNLYTNSFDVDILK